MSHGSTTTTRQELEPQIVVVVVGFLKSRFRVSSSDGCLAKTGCNSAPRILHINQRPGDFPTGDTHGCLVDFFDGHPLQSFG